MNSSNSIPASDLFLRVLEGHRQWLSVKEICERLNSAGFDAVLAGGCVRDSLLGVVPKDFDVATSATPDDVERLFEKTIAVGKSFGVIVVRVDDGSGVDMSVEVATFRRDGQYEDGRHPTQIAFSDREEDAKRRDFTVNALFYDPSKREITDFTGGLVDLKCGLLRVVGDPAERFLEDKLRLLRAVRFSGQLDFAIEHETEKAIRVFSKQLVSVSRERIREEVDKLLLAKNAERGFQAIDRLDLGEAVFEDWAQWLLPVNPRVFAVQDLDIRLGLFLYPALKSAGLERVQERLRNWKYGRSFVELLLWLLKNETALRPDGPDPIRKAKSADEVFEDFSARPSDSVATLEALEGRTHSLAEREWMSALELWTDPRAPRACAILDLIHGSQTDQKRFAALQRRGLILGEPDPMRVNAKRLLDVQSHLSGPLLGRELRRVNRLILLRG